MKQYILFDLDGTLVNSKEGIIKSVYYALDSLGIEESEPEKLSCFIGPPLDYSFRTFYQLNDTGVRKAVEKYRERYAQKGVYECKMYDGMEQVVKTLSASGAVLCLATSKPQPFAEQILEMFHLKEYFKVIVGATFDGRISEKSDVVAEVVRQLPGVSKEEMIMIGDREHDIIGAKENGIESIGVRHGFAKPGEFEAAGANYIVKDADELLALLQTLQRK